MHFTQRPPLRRLAITAVFATTAIMLSACSGDTGGNSSGPPVDTGTVRIDMPVNATSLDPINNPYLVDNELVGLTRSGLFQFVAGSATETEPTLAEGITASEDYLQYTVTLKEGLTFSDGSPLTSADVVASYTRLRDTPGPNQAEASSLAEVAAPDETTVDIDLVLPNVDLSQILALPSFGIVPAVAASDDGYFDGEPVFSGAYVPEGDVTSEKYALVRNENFGGPVPVIERLEFTVVQDAVTTATRLQGGEIDLAPAPPREIAAQLSGDLTSVTLDRVASLFLIPNNRDGALFSDVRIRQALAWAIDRQAIGELVYGPEVSVQSGPYPVPADYPTPVDVYPAQDMKKAKDLLVGTECENGCTFSISYFASAAENEGRAATLLQQMLEPLGMALQPTPVESQQFIQNSLDGAFDMNVVESGSFNVPSSFAGAFETQVTQCIYAGCVNDEIQPAMDALLGAADGAAADEASTAVLDIFAAWTPIIPVAGALFDYGVKSDLSDVIGLQPSGLFWIAAE